MAQRVFSLLLGIFTLMTLTAGSVRADWPQWRGPNRDGKAIDVDFRTDWKTHPPKHIWTIKGIGYGFGSIAEVDDHLYTTGYTDENEVVSAIDLDTKKIVWQTPVAGFVDLGNASREGSRSTPTVVGDRLYVVPSVGKIVCLNRNTGKIVWQKSFAENFGSKNQQWGYAESPLVDGDRVVCTPGSDSTLMVALNRETGEVLWKTPYADLGEKGKKEAGYASIVISHGAGVKQYVQMTGKGLVGVRASDGKLLWHYNKIANGVAVIPTPIVQGDYVFGSSGYQAGAALLHLVPEDDHGVRAEEVYYLDAKVFQNHHGQMILDKGHIYAGRGHGHGFPVCLDFKTGKIVWGEKLRGPGHGSAAVTFVDGHIIFRYQQGLVALIEATPEGYHLKGTFKPAYVKGPNWAHPVVADGLLLLRQRGRIMAFDVSDE